MKILFVNDYKYSINDGLTSALSLLKNENFKIENYNLNIDTELDLYKYDFVLGHGAFNSQVDLFCKNLNIKKALCIAGVTLEPDHSKNYDILFYETDYFGKTLKHKNKIKAFGVNTEIYKKINSVKIWDVISVGALSLWKRQSYLTNKIGNKIVVGEIQLNNLKESLSIIDFLLKNNIAVSPVVSSEILSSMYNLSKLCYIPANIYGGGERAVLEARSCGIDVEVENDNPKLKELLYGPIYTHFDYAENLKKGILNL